MIGKRFLWGGAVLSVVVILVLFLVPDDDPAATSEQPSEPEPVQRSSPLPRRLPSAVPPFAATAAATNSSTDDLLEPSPPPEEAEQSIDWVVVVNDRASLARLRAAAAEAGVELEVRERLLSARLRLPSREALDALFARAGVIARSAPNQRVSSPPVPPAPPEGVTYVSFADHLLVWLGLGNRPADWGTGVKVAVLDTAFDTSDAALRKTRVAQQGEVGPAGAHGLAVASIIGASGGNVNGIAPGVELLSIPVLSAQGAGSSFELAAAIVDAVDAGADIINLSLGCREECPVLNAAVGYAADSGVVIVAAAGNDGTDALFWPAADTRTLAVGAVDAEGQYLWFSNKGENLDIAAPGLGITAAAVGGSPSAPFSGTSAAVPVVAGLLAGIVAEESVTPAEATQLLLAYTDEAGPAGDDEFFGSGVVNPVRVLEREEDGIVDVSVTSAWIEDPGSADSDAIVELGVQNRGTVSVGSTRLTVRFAGGVQEWPLYDLLPGAVEARSVRVSADYLRNGPVTVDYSASITSGERDIRPRNNRRRVVVSSQ